MTSIASPQIDLSKVVTRFSVQGDLTIESRSAAGAWQAGRWYEGVAATASIVASVQPLGGREMQALPEGVRTKSGIVVYSTSEIVPQGRLNADLGDTLIWKGVRHECINVEPWDTNGRYWRAVAVQSEQ